MRYPPAVPLGRWQEENEREKEEWEVLKETGVGETVIVKLTAVADLEILRVSGIYGLIEEPRSLPRDFGEMRPFPVIIHSEQGHSVALSVLV